jgi:hypothetical protein
MGTDVHTPWSQTITGALFINGVVTAVVSVGTTWVINNAAQLPWPLIVTTFLVVGVVVFLLASLFQKRLREAIWVRPARWLSGLRVTTKKQRDAAGRTATKKGLALANDNTKALIAAEMVRAERAEKEVDDLKVQIEGLQLGLRMAKSKVSEAEEAAQAARAELATRQARPGASKLPRPAPRWRIYADEDEPDGLDFLIANTVPRSVAREVRIEPDEDMEVLDAGHWEDLSGSAIGNFRAEVTPNGIDYGVNITITWYDDQNQQRTTAVRVPGRDGRFAQSLRV